MLAVLFGCKSSRFAKGGVFVDGVDRYFNTELENSNVWLYMDIKPFEYGSSGLKTKQLYAEDKKVLESVGIRRKGTKFLFSAVPESNPKYHLIAIRHNNNVKNLEGYKRMEYETAHYFQKDLEKARLDIRHIYIPYGKQGGLSLIYYISTEGHLSCRFCKIDYLARINALELQQKAIENLNWQIIESTDGGPRKSISLKPKSKILNSHRHIFLKVYLDFQNGNTGLQYFQILKPDENKDVDLLLCPGKYYLEYQDSKLNMLYRDTVNVTN